MPVENYVIPHPATKTYWGEHWNGETGGHSFPRSTMHPLFYVFQDAGQKRSDWRRAIAHGENATTARTATFMKWGEGQPGFIIHNVRNGSCSGNYQMKSFGVIPYFPQMWTMWAYDLPDPSVPSDLVNAAITSALKRVKEARTPWNGGTFFGELPELVRSLSKAKRAFEDGIARAVQRTIQSGKNRRRYRGFNRRQRRRSRLLDWSDAYLGYIFGAAPLVSDIQDLRKALNSSKPWGIQRFTGSAKELVEDSWTSATRNIILGNAKHNASLRVRTKVVRKARCYVWVDWGEAPVSNLDAFGVGVSDFVPTLWELLPWSFLVDYWGNVGDVLTFLGVAPLVKFACLTKRETFWRHATAVPEQHGGCTYISHSGVGGSADFTREFIDREPLASVSVPLTFEVPSLGSLKWLNMASLAVSQSKLTTWVNN